MIEAKVSLLPLTNKPGIFPQLSLGNIQGIMGRMTAKTGSSPSVLGSTTTQQCPLAQVLVQLLIVSSLSALGVQHLGFLPCVTASRNQHTAPRGAEGRQHIPNPTLRAETAPNPGAQPAAPRALNGRMCWGRAPSCSCLQEKTIRFPFIQSWEFSGGCPAQG